ncbi:5'-deoxynucleotidase [Pseudoalteromonas sp. S554]|uniref:5'-deoxynucleotidase n=1 Tax=Pseudoalteromonas sp. S554 TaxID=2066516 RepID=UPI00110CF72D|nr:5'-deoxynucleotidase [Pseudoalteromonas sp. S554]TMS80562.1 5'-deoxynucleotidase [Pseudoalteromonas sp. S554]
MQNFLESWLKAKNINRWPLHHCLSPTNDAVHSFECSIVAHLIGVIDRDLFNNDVNPDRMATMCIYHETGELLLGDINSVAKNHNKDVHDTIKGLERHFEDVILSSLPPELQNSLSSYTTQCKTSREGYLCKASDDICAYIEALKELKLGNYEFAEAVNSTKERVDSWGLKYECVAYFIDKFLTSLNQTVDTLYRKQA